jgi:hypothetical protein
MNANRLEKPKMRAMYCGALAAFVAIAGLAQARSSKKQVAEQHAAREKLIGAGWECAFHEPSFRSDIVRR